VSLAGVGRHGHRSGHGHPSQLAARLGLPLQRLLPLSLVACVLGLFGAKAQTVPASAPGLLLGVTVGRFGCLLGGCCAGRPTCSRWGIWSSNRRLGVRRVPVQLLEASFAGVLGALALAVVLLFGASAGGLVFVAGIAAYTAGRQLLFPLRDIPRATT
jgi:phosphatidylglycerol---prolipoprotein diacylglyceryl transferase